MELQNFEKRNLKIKESFRELLFEKKIKERLKFSWSNWGFGLESLEDSLS